MATAPVRMASSRTAAAWAQLFCSSANPHDSLMRLPRRIFLNVVIFVSSFLVVSYHKTHRAPAAPCSRSFLLSYCSTPPLKRKIKFSLQTVPFVPTPAAFFSGGWVGVVYPALHFCRSGQRGLESAAQFSTGCIVIGGTVCRAASFIQVVYPAHNFGEPALESPAQFTAGGVVIGSTISVRCAARGKKFRLLSDAQFRLFSAGGRLLSTAQFARCGKLIIVIGSTIRILGGFPKVSKPGCYPAHISGSGVVIERTVSKL